MEDDKITIPTPPERFTRAEAARRGAFSEDAITLEDASASAADLGDIANG